MQIGGKNMEDLPLGFGMALAQRSEAMQRFCALTDEEQRMVIDHTHQIHSKQEMQAFVDHLANHSAQG